MSSPRRPRTVTVVAWLVCRLAAIVTWLVPREIGYRLCDLAGSLTYLLAGQMRRAALANVSRVLGRPTTDAYVRLTARRCFQTSGRNFWDLCSLPHLRRQQLLERTAVDAAAWARLEQVVSERHGLIIVTAHLGAFDIASQLLTGLSVPFMPLTAQTTSSWLFLVVTQLRRSWGAVVEPVSPGTLRRLIGHLRRGGVVGLVADRDVYHTGRPVWLFGHRTTLPIGPVRIALETGAPVVAIFSPREGDRYRLELEEFPIQRTGDVEHDIDVNMAGLAALFERKLRIWPDQWVMFQRAWLDTAQDSGIHVGHLGLP